MGANRVPITIPYRLRSRAKAAGNSAPTLAHSTAIDIDGEPLDNASQMLKEANDLQVQLRSSPLSEVTLSLPSFSSLSPNPLPLHTIDENTVADFNDHLTHSNSPNLFPLHTDDDDTDYNDHPTSSDSGSNHENMDDLEQLDNLEHMDDVTSPSLAELHTAEAICQLKTHQSFVEPMNSTFYGPKRNSWAAEKNYGHHTLQQQTRQPTPIPVLHQSTSLLNPSADNYGTFSFYSNSSQAFPWSAEAFENYFPRASLQTQPIVQSYGKSSQASPWSAEAFENHFPRAGLQTQPIVQTYEAHDRYRSQYGQPQYCLPQYGQLQGRHQNVQAQDGRPQYVQPQHVEHSQQTTFPHTLGPFVPQLNSISQDAAAAAQQYSINTGNLAQTNGSRKRKSTDGAEKTNTTTKRRRRTGHYIPNDPPGNNPPAPLSDDELKRRAVHLLNTDPWLCLGITRADHLAATTSLLDKIRDRSLTYQHHLQRQHTLNPIPMASLDTLAPQSPESQHTVLNSMHQDIVSKPLRNGENRKYHFVFGCFLASQTGASGQYTLSFNTVAQCLGTEQRRESMVSQSSFDQHRESMFSQQSSDHQQLHDQHRTSVSFVRGGRRG